MKKFFKKMVTAFKKRRCTSCWKCRRSTAGMKNAQRAEFCESCMAKKRRHLNSNHHKTTPAGNKNNG